MKPGNLLATRNGRFLTFGLLYISEGIPYGFTSVAMVTFMAMSNLAISVGNYWQVVVPEGVDYVAVLYFDSLFAVVAVLVIQFLRGRDEQPGDTQVPARLSATEA